MSVGVTKLFVFAMVLLLATVDRCVAGEPLIAEFPFDDPLRLIRVPVQVRGETFSFVLDTGASMSAYSSTMQWPAIPIKYVMAQTGSGRRKVALYPRPPSSLGPIRLAESDLIAALDFTELSAATHHPTHGILGMDFLNHSIVQLDFESQTVRFLASVPPDCGIQLPLDASKPEGVSLKFDVANSSIDAAIDTGSDRELMISRSNWDELQKQGHLTQIQATQTTTLGGKTISNQGQLDSVRLGQFSIDHVDVMDATGGGKVGMKFLSRFLVTLDFPGKAAYLKPSRYYSKARQRDASGLGLTLLNSQIQVKEVREGSPADDIGLRRGDVILNIEGRKGEDWSLFDLRNALSDPGKTLKMTIQRTGQSLEVSIILAEF